MKFILYIFFNNYSFFIKGTKYFIPYFFLFFISIQLNAQIFPDPSPNCGNGSSNPSDLGDAAGNIDASVMVTGSTDANGIFNISTNEICVQGDGDNQLGCGDDPEWFIRIDVSSILSSLPICEPVNFRVCRRGDFGQQPEIVFIYDENLTEIGNIPGAPQNDSAFDCTESPICTIVTLDPCVFNPQAIADGFFDLTLYTNGNIGGNSVGDFCSLSPGPQSDADFNSCTNDQYCPNYTQVVNGNFLNQDNGGPMITSTCTGCNCLFIDYFAVNTNSFADPGFTVAGNGGCDGPVTLTPNPSNCNQSWSSPDGATFSASSGVVTFSANNSGTYTVCNNVGLVACQEQFCQSIDLGPCCDDFTNAIELCNYISDPANAGAAVAALDCDGGGIDNQTECANNNDPYNICDDFPQGAADKDGDGIPDFDDLDSDNDGILDEDECQGSTPANCIDTDGDGIQDNLDLDSDNDGIPDAIEACGNVNLTLEECALDWGPGNLTTYQLDANGCSTGVVANACPEAPIDTDGDGTPDYLDLDSDGDGCPDAVEAGTDGSGTSNTTDTYVAGTVDGCGLLLSINCAAPGDDDWIDSSTSTGCDCDWAEANNIDICAHLNTYPDATLAELDCDDGGVNNQVECDNNSDSDDPSDDCDAVANYTGGICQYLEDFPGSPFGMLDCDGGGVDNQTECNDGSDPGNPSDDCEAAAEGPGGICGYIAANPNSSLATLDCDGGGVDNQTECDSGGDPNDPIDDDCDVFNTTPFDMCTYLDDNPNSLLANLDCDGGGVDNQTECDAGGDPGDPIDDDCESFLASGEDVCDYLDANPNSPIADFDCDGGGESNSSECDSGQDPDNPIDDSCASFNMSGEQLCTFIAQYPNNPIALEDCDNGGVDNITECMSGGNPDDPIDDSCENFEASGIDLCTYLNINPNSPLASADCDGGGVDNQTECDSGDDPFDESDDCDAAEAYENGICDYLEDNPGSSLGALDCDGGGAINSLECTDGGDPSDPNDDSCENFEASGLDLCVYLTQNPNSPLAAADCDGGGVDNATECGSGGDPFDPNDDSCDSFDFTNLDLCQYIADNPGTPLGNLDCDNGGVSNIEECNDGGDPSDPNDDSCDSFNDLILDLCDYIDANPGTPLATLDCDNGGVDNITECNGGGDPSDPNDDSCDSFDFTNLDLCEYIAQNPGTPLENLDCDNGGVSNFEECGTGGNPSDPSDDSCDNFNNTMLDLCQYLEDNPGSPLANLDCDNGGVSNIEECGAGGNPSDPIDDSCENFNNSGLNLCAYLSQNPGSPLATEDCDNGGVDNITECTNGGFPNYPPDDSCENANAVFLDICVYLQQYPNSPLADLDCDGGGVTNAEECAGNNDPNNPQDDNCDFEEMTGLNLCDYLAINPNSPLGTLDCDGGGVNNVTECGNGGDPYFAPDDSCDEALNSFLDICNYINQNPGSPLANVDCDGGGIINSQECNDGGDPSNPNDDSCDNFEASGEDLCEYLENNPFSPLTNQDCDNGGVDNKTECDSNDDPFDPNDDCNLVCNDNNECTDDILNEDNCTCQYIFSCTNDIEAPVIIPDFENTMYSGGEYTMVCNNVSELSASSVSVVDNCDDSPTVTFVDEFVSYGDCAEDGYLSKWRCYWVAVDECGNESIFEIFVTLACPPCPDDNNPCTYDTYDGCDCVYEQIPSCGYQPNHCTFPQDFYGGQTASYGGSTYIEVLNSSFGNCGGYITVGIPGQSLTVADVACLDALLPAYGGVALCQPGNIVYSGLCSYTPQLGNSLIGELIVLNLNVAYDYNLLNISLCNVNNCVYAPQSIRNLLGNDCTVSSLIDLANNALGGVYGNDLSLLNDILIAIRLINDGYSYCGDVCAFNREIQEQIIKESDKENTTEQPITELPETQEIEEVQETVVDVQEIEEVQKFEFSISPNPAKDFIELNISLVDKVNIGSIKILQLDGKEMYSQDFEGQKGYNINSININNLPVGIYFIAVKLGDAVHLQKLIKI